MIQAHKINFKTKKSFLIKDIDFHCSPGEFIAVIGPNGAGKSTFMNLLSNEIEQQGNSILFKSCPYKKWCSEELSKHKTKFSQSFTQDIPLSVQQVVLMGRYPYFDNNPTPEDLHVVQHTMECLGICKFKDRQYNHLSGGEKQRVHLARVLAQLNNAIDNKLLFLDEPLNNLDVLHQHRILELIKEFTALGNTAIVIIHDLNIAGQFADKILLLDQGKKICFDQPNKVLNEELLSKVYQFPCKVISHPVNNNPLILFGA